MTPLVSVVVPTYRGAEHLAATLESVLAQTLTDLEVVVADDASTDATLAVAAAHAERDPRVRVLPGERNLGAVANWNRAVAAARGEYVKVMGQDDLLRPQCLELQAAVLERHAGVGIVVAGREVVDAAGRRLLPGRRPLGGHEGVIDTGPALRRIVRSGTNSLGEPVTVLLRRSVVEATGPFRQDLPYVVDLDYWCRALQVAPLYCLPTTLCAFRVSGQSWSVALAGDQAAQTCALLEELRRGHPEAVSAADVRLGCVRAGLTARSRRLLYALLRVRDRAAVLAPT